MSKKAGTNTTEGNIGADAGEAGEWSKEDMEKAVPLPMPEVDDDEDASEGDG